MALVDYVTCCRMLDGTVEFIMITYQWTRSCWHQQELGESFGKQSACSPVREICRRRVVFHATFCTSFNNNEVHSTWHLLPLCLASIFLLLQLIPRREDLRDGDFYETVIKFYDIDINVPDSNMRHYVSCYSGIPLIIGIAIGDVGTPNLKIKRAA